MVHMGRTKIGSGKERSPYCLLWTNPFVPTLNKLKKGVDSVLSRKYILGPKSMGEYPLSSANVKWDLKSELVKQLFLLQQKLDKKHP